MNKRGVMFFTTDTIIAVTIIVVTVMILFSFYANAPVSSDVKFEVDQYVTYITETSMGNLPHGTYTESLSQEERNLKVYEMISVLYHSNKKEKAKELAGNIRNIIVRDAYGLEYRIDDELIFSDDPFEDININLTSNRITYFVYNDTLYGPNSTKVSLWY